MNNNLPVIRELSPHTINLIAAGEVVERPASIIKELVENSIDAKSSQIIIHIQNGGTDLISITDNGHGMTPESIPLAAKRHATSKLPDNNLSHISSFGFRGEALASIVAVSHVNITSRTQNSDTTWHVAFPNNTPSPPAPSKHFAPHGTKITVENLFYNIPARKTFLRSLSVETRAITELFKELSLSSLSTAFSLFVDGKKRFDLPPYDSSHSDPLAARIHDIIGHNFIENSLPLDFTHNSFPLSLKGRLGLPTFNAPTSQNFHIFVNGRIVKDKVLNAVIRSAYGDTLPKGRYPQAVLFISIDPLFIDVNAHPAKIEIRLRQPVETKNILRHIVKNHIKDTPPATSSHLAQSFVHATSHPSPSHNPSSYSPSPSPSPSRPSPAFTQAFHKNITEHTHPQKQHQQNPTPPHDEQGELLPKTGPLGEARSQIMGNYILAETHDSLVIVDQHAAHERIIYEHLKNQLAHTPSLPSQMSLIPRSLPCGSPENLQLIMQHQKLWERFGFSLAPHKDDHIRIKAAPTILKDSLPENLILDIINALGDDSLSSEDLIEEQIFTVLSKTACHAAVRGYTPLSHAEMNTLLRSIENSPLASQCNHGRPSFVTLALKDLEALFERR